MTATTFLSVLVGASVVSILLTQAIKNAYKNAGRKYSANIIALIDAIVVGCGGTAVVYMLAEIPWTVNNIICVVLMGFAVWIGAMLGFDKILQTMRQVKEIQRSVENGDVSRALEQLEELDDNIQQDEKDPKQPKKKEEKIIL